MRQKRSSEFTSRQHMLSRDFELYYYSDTHFSSVGSHSHDYFEFYFFESGTVQMIVEGKTFRLRKGDLLVVPPGARHRAVVTDDVNPYRRFVFWIGLDYLGELLREAPEYGYLTERAAKSGSILCHFDPLTFNSIRIRLFALLDELHTARFGRDEQLRLEVRILLLLMNRLAHEQTEKDSPRDVRNKYALLSDFIDNHLSEEMSIERIASEFYLSKSYVSHLFRENTGLSIYQYLTKKRLAAVAAAIRSGEPVGETCLQYGFRDYSAFYRAFRKEYGVSPSQYREMHGM